MFLKKKYNLSQFKGIVEEKAKSKLGKIKIEKEQMLVKIPFKRLIILNILIIILALILNYLDFFKKINFINKFLYFLSLGFNGYYFIAFILLILTVIFVLRNKKHSRNILKTELENQRVPIKEIVDRTKHKNLEAKEWVKTGIAGFDKLLEKGIPRGASILVAGGTGTGKTNFCLKILNNAAMRNEKCLYISLEESEFRLKQHMLDFKWDPTRLEEKDLLRIKRVDPFEISRSVEALLARAKGELKMNIGEISELIPYDYKPEWVVIDSLTALGAAFREEDDSYRIYVEQLFRYLENLNITSFLISETEQIPTRFSKSGVEEFLADGVIVLYHIRKGSIRERAIEILKMRGAVHQEKIVAMQILIRKGVEVYPEQELFGGIQKET